MFIFKKFTISLVLFCLLIVTIGATAPSCNKQNNTNGVIVVKDYRKEIAKEIHTVENALLRLTELKRTLASNNIIDKEASVRISRALIEVNNISMSINKFLKEHPVIDVSNKVDLVKLITDGLSFISELSLDGSFISNAEVAKNYFELVEIIRAALLGLQIVIEGVNK